MLGMKDMLHIYGKEQLGVGAEMRSSQLLLNFSPFKHQRLNVGSVGAGSSST